ncbi:hypothetical protein [Sphingomonas sp. ABOLF]|uniref:hypothetical protein n=1 Tax=Sphingomonas sp. ABOLF TaxID=1985879 RepID=UPI000F7F11DB|nr:hypothetical protein [Sphingomonas sp. ABOLF]
MTAPDEAPLSCPTLEDCWANPGRMEQLMAQRHEEQRQAHAALTDSFNRAHAKRLAERGMTA